MKRKYSLEEALENKRKKNKFNLKYHFNLLCNELKDYIFEFLPSNFFLLNHIQDCELCNNFTCIRYYRNITVPLAPLITKNEILVIKKNYLDIEVYFKACNECIIRRLDLIFFREENIYYIANENKKRILKSLNLELYSKYLFTVKYIWERYNIDMIKLLLLKESMKDKLLTRYFDIKLLKSLIIDLLIYKKKRKEITYNEYMKQKLKEEYQLIKI